MMIKTPKHLKADGKRLFDQIVTDFCVEDPAGIALLTTACECLDRMKDAQKVIGKHGVTILDRYGGLRVNPACLIEKDSRSGFLRALKDLNLDVEPLRDRPGRPGGS